jgi:hypothetical protein
MSVKYWESFYRDFEVNKPSYFARWFLETYPDLSGQLIDIGCGNGRDSYYLSKGFQVIGVDRACKPDNTMNAIFFQTDIKEMMAQIKSPDVVYMRFLFHAVSPQVQNLILKWAKKYIAIEARTIDDEPEVYRQHKRWLVDPKKLKKQLKDFKILHWEEGQGLSPFRGEDPHLIRVVAKRK